MSQTIYFKFNKSTLLFDIGLSVIPITCTHTHFILQQILWLKLTLIKHIMVYQFSAASNCISFVLFIVEIQLIIGMLRNLPRLQKDFQGIRTESSGIPGSLHAVRVNEKSLWKITFHWFLLTRRVKFWIDTSFQYKTEIQCSKTKVIKPLFFWHLLYSMSHDQL